MELRSSLQVCWGFAFSIYEYMLKLSIAFQHLLKWSFFYFALVYWYGELHSLFFLTEIQLTYNIMLISSVQQIVIWYLYILQNGHHSKSRQHSLPTMVKVGKDISIELTNIKSLMRKYYKYLISVNLINEIYQFIEWHKYTHYIHEAILHGHDVLFILHITRFKLLIFCSRFLHVLRILKEILIYTQIFNRTHQ